MPSLFWIISYGHFIHSGFFVILWDKVSSCCLEVTFSGIKLLTALTAHQLNYHSSLLMTVEESVKQMSRNKRELSSGEQTREMIKGDDRTQRGGERNGNGENTRFCDVLWSNSYICWGMLSWFIHTYWLLYSITYNTTRKNVPNKCSQFWHMCSRPSLHISYILWL